MLLDSVPQLVKTISVSAQPSSDATLTRASRIADAGLSPIWCGLDGLP